ncbi:MAG TPA: hypothetical protein VL461_12285 [Dictyobacter sp.]|nr:hypothetical protein [Dictyobacter sp.]
MPETKHYSPAEAVDYLNEKLKPAKLIDQPRLARLRREKRIKGEKIGGTNTSVYTKKALDMVTLADLEDKRKKKSE